jgi:hypothetical protein
MSSVIVAKPITALAGWILFSAVAACVSPGQSRIRLVAKQNDEIKKSVHDSIGNLKHGPILNPPIGRLSNERKLNDR